MNTHREPAAGDASRDRLARISHHFLSDEGERLRFVILTDSTGEALLSPDSLARGFAQSGKSVAVVDSKSEVVLYFFSPETRRARTSRDEPEALFHRLATDIQSAPAPDIMISASMPGAYPEGPVTAALIGVPADPQGMRNAYLSLKRHAEQARRNPIGITITGAVNHQDAEAGFRRFSDAAHRFLDIDLRSYACLFPAGPAVSDQTHQFKYIAGLLLADWQAHGQSAVGAKSAPTPLNTEEFP